MQPENKINFCQSYFNDFSKNSNPRSLYNELLDSIDITKEYFSKMLMADVENSPEFNKLKNNIKDRCNIVFTYSVFEMISYIKDRKSNITFSKNHSFDPSLEQMHKKASEIIIKNSNLELLLKGYLFDKDSSLDQNSIPKEIIHLIIESNLNLELLDFKNFRKTIHEDRAEWFSDDINF